MTESRSGLRVTEPIGDQLRVLPDQRAGFCFRARGYTAWRAARAAVALAHHRSISTGNTPCSRHQAPLPASSSAAMVITASSQPRAVQRSNVGAVTPISLDTSPTSALSGGNNLATTLFLNASPYRAISPPRRPQVQLLIEATTILTHGEGTGGSPRDQWLPFDYARLRAIYKGNLVLNDGYDFASAQQAIATGAADAIAFGRALLANPDLVERFRSGAPLNQPDYERRLFR